MKKLVGMLSIVALMVSCKDNNSNGQVYVAPYTPSESSVVVTPEVANLGEGLNLQMLGELVKNSTNAQDIEDKLNSTGSINNLDLDNDGNVDYIKVTEYGEGNNRGLSFTVDMADGQTQEVATVVLDKSQNNVNMNIQGNNHLYGNNSHYSSHYSIGDVLLMHYLFSYHRPYYSPYHYGYYPRGYHSYRSVPMSSYRSRVSTTTRTTTITKTRPSSSVSKVTSPNANKYSSSVANRAKSMVRPTSSQKSFSVTSANKSRPNTSGFRASSSNSSSSSYSSSRPKSSSSSSSWLGGSSSKSKSNSSGYSSSSSRRSGGSSFFGGSSSSNRRSSGSSFGGSSRRSGRR